MLFMMHQFWWRKTSHEQKGQTSCYIWYSICLQHVSKSHVFKSSISCSFSVKYDFYFLKVFRTKRMHFIEHYKRSFIFLIKSTIRVSVSPWVLLHYHFHSALEKSWWPNAPGSDLRVLICCSTSCRLYPHTRTSPVIGPTAWVYSEAALRVQQVRRSSKLL